MTDSITLQFPPKTAPVDYVQDILTNGGGTYFVSRGYNPSITGRAEFTTGYMVAVRGRERKFPVYELDAEVLAQFIVDNANYLGGIGYFLGAWVSDGYVYLDVSSVYQDREAAEYHGRANKQIAIWDNALGREITL